MHKNLRLFLIICLLAASFLLGRKGAALASSTEKPSEFSIVIDAGHGGNDPGKIGIHNEQEKDINLAIAQDLEPLFANRGFRVVQTRTEDICLAPEGVSSKKRADMQERIRIIKEAEPLAAVSIHQNSYSDSSVSGPQVFYYSGSVEGKALAESVQESLNNILEPIRPRVVKANDDYYLLKHSNVPMVIVECGFLSNPDEATALSDELYQNRVARAIYLGTSAYLKEQGLLMQPDE